MEKGLKEKADLLREALVKSQANTEKMVAVLSTFDRRLSTIDTILHPFRGVMPEIMTCHVNVNKSLRKTEVIVNQFDQIREIEVVISKGPSEDLDRFLEAMDQLVRLSRFFDSRKSYASSERTLLHLNNLHSKAITMTEIEFNKMMTALSKPIDPTKLYDYQPSKITSPSAVDHDDSSNSKHETETETKHETVEYKLPTLISPQYIPRLHNLVVRLVLDGHHMQCLNIYREARRNALHQSLNNLGNSLRMPNIGNVDFQKMQWENMEVELPKWIDFMRMSVKSLFAGERKLCVDVFEGIEESFLDQCFVEVTSSSLARLVSFGEAVMKIKNAPERLFKLLDMYEMICEIEPEMKALFASKEYSNMLQSMVSLRKWLVATVIEILAEFREMVMKEKSNIHADVVVHPISSYVMNYLKFLLDYQEVLEQLFVEHKSTDKEESLQFATSVVQILQALQNNLEIKSKTLKDQGQSHIFLMNNFHYMVTSVRKTESARILLEDDWIPRQRKAVQVNSNQYRRVSWSKVLESISSQGLLSSSGGSNNPMENTLSTSASKDVIKERFKNFNAQFEEQYQKQCLWRVHDRELRESLCLAVAELLIPAYRSFVQRFGPMVENSKSKCIKYDPEDVEKMLEELFQGKPSS